jgi:hypothetical protein
LSVITHRVSPQAARYTPAGGVEKCAYCRYFMPQGWCGKVIGPVSPRGWCKYYSREMVQRMSSAGYVGSDVSAPPSFVLDYVVGGVLGTGATYARTSTAMSYNAAGALVSSAINAPRFDFDPVTHAARGLLLENTTTNLLLNSATLVTQSVAVTAQPYTLAFEGTGTVTLSGASTATLVGTGASPARVSLTFTPAAGTLTCTVTGSAVNGQLEASPFPGSYMPTAGASVGRGRDQLSYPIASITGFDQTRGTLAFDYALEGWTPGFAAPIAFVGASTTNDFIYADQFTSAGATGTAPTMFAARTRAGGVNQASGDYSPAPVPVGAIHRGAVSWALGDVTRGSHDGGGTVSNTGVNGVLPVITSLLVANQAGAQSQVSLWARRIRYWPRLMGQSELDGVTT